MWYRVYYKIDYFKERLKSTGSSGKLNKEYWRSIKVFE